MNRHRATTPVTGGSHRHGLSAAPLANACAGTRERTHFPDTIRLSTLGPFDNSHPLPLGSKWHLPTTWECTQFVRIRQVQLSALARGAELVDTPLLRYGSRCYERGSDRT